MRKPLVAGNWKMHKTIAEARQLLFQMLGDLQSIEGVDVVLFPPFTALQAISALLEHAEIGIGAQNMHWEASGAYTGEISPPMVGELGEYVILGHSERRAYFDETDDGVNRKVGAALAHDLIPIVCVGETLEENEAGRTRDVVERQIRRGLEGQPLDSATRLIIAYEPVWAIGTGRAATAPGADEVIRGVIRPALADLFGMELAAAIRILYGGSVNAENAREFFVQPDIDGGLVGGASLKAAEFVQIVRAAVP